jgi:endoglucanase
MSVMRLLLLCLVVGQPGLAETAADRFQPKRGLNFEIWNEWLTADQMVAREGFLDVYPDWRRLVAPDAVADLKTKGFDFVRLPFDPSPMLRLGPGAAQDALIDQIQQTATEVQETGLKVIVDLHSIPRPDEVWGTDSIVQNAQLFEAYLILVGKVAQRLDGFDPDRTALELLNEPTHDCEAIGGTGTMAWPDQLVRLHGAARTGAPELPLVLSGACWGGIDGLGALDPAKIGDDNVIWSFHSYDPFLFTHQGASWTTWVNRYFDDVPYPPETLDDAEATALVADATDRMNTNPDETLDVALIAPQIAEYRSRTGAEWVGIEPQAAADWADRHGIPRHRLILGEFGSMRDKLDGSRHDPASRVAFLRDKREAVEALGIGWAVWVWNGSFGITEDDATRAVAPETCSALGLTC